VTIVSVKFHHRDSDGIFIYKKNPEDMRSSAGRSAIKDVSGVGHAPTVPTSNSTYPSIVVERHGTISWVLRSEHRSYGLQVRDWIRLKYVIDLLLFNAVEMTCESSTYFQIVPPN
jgi:hypothetical protein